MLHALLRSKDGQPKKQEPLPEIILTSEPIDLTALLLSKVGEVESIA